MNPQDPTQHVREILDDFLGEYHRHLCPTCEGSKDGCINCRHTGYNQTPCQMCDKDGIAFKRKKKALAELSKVVDEARKEQSALTSKWIEDHIRLLHKDPQFKETTASVAFIYAEDQARQGRYKALQQPNQSEENNKESYE